MSKLTTVGDRIKLKHKAKEYVGVVKYVGILKGKNGIYYGVELEKANTGEHNGDYKNVKYFTTVRKKGIFIKISAITKTNSKNNTAPRVTVGTSVKVTKSNTNGTIQFIGELESKKGIYYGIELDSSNGKNSGTYKGRSYFQCDDNCGIFCKENGFETTKTTYNIKPKTKKQKSTKSNPSSPVPNNNINYNNGNTIAIKEYDINRRKDISKVVNVLNGIGTENDLNSVIHSYDDKKENEDIEWLKIIATLKTINDSKNQNEAQINSLKQEIQQLKNKSPVPISPKPVVAIDNSEELKDEINKLKIEIAELKESKDDNENKSATKISALKQQIVTLKNNIILAADKEVSEESKDLTEQEIERRMKFEKEELKQKYESQIKTLQTDKQRLERQLSKRPSLSPQPPMASPISDTNEQKTAIEYNQDDFNSLKKEKEQLQTVVKAKDEIINNAKDEITRLKKEIATIKEEEEKEELQVDRLSRDRAKKLLEERVSDQQQGSLSNVTKSAEKKKTITELLSESSKEDAVSIIHSMGVIKFEYDKKLKKDTYNLDLTNNSVLKRLTNDQRKQFMFLLAHCICDDSGQQKIEKVKMSNMGVLDDKLFVDFVDILINNFQYFLVEEWWLESNKIGNEGMKKLGELLGMNPKSLEVVKMYNNKTVVNTQTINGLLDNIEKNDKLQKFTFEWRLTQHRDRIDKQVRKNQDLKRKLKWAGKIK